MPSLGRLSLLFLSFVFFVVADEKSNAAHGDGRKLTIGQKKTSKRMLKSGKIVPHIVDGKPADPDRYPYMATLLTDEAELDCGGTLISPQFVLSAAHCGGFASMVAVGRYKLNVTRGFLFSSNREFDFPRYDEDTQDGDFMLIKLSGSVLGVSTPRLATNLFYNRLQNGTELTVMGWGDTSSGGDMSNTLLEADVGYIPQSTCQDLYDPLSLTISNRMICAGGIGSKDACQGDSGGPLIYKDDNPARDVLVGVVSWGEGCADGYPGVYAKVGSVSIWISRIIGRFGDVARFI